MQNSKVIKTRSIYKGYVFDVVEEDITLSNGTQITRAVVQHPGAVVIIPQHADGTLLLVRQYRHAVRQTLLEFPAGTLEAGETPLVCADREIQEEVGHAAGEWISLGTLYPTPGFCNELQYLFLAKNLTTSQLDADEDEEIEVISMKTHEVEKAIVDGEMCDGKSISIFARAKLKGLFDQ